jgi:hypothetical protein
MIGYEAIDTLKPDSLCAANPDILSTHTVFVLDPFELFSDRVIWKVFVTAR